MKRVSVWLVVLLVVVALPVGAGKAKGEKGNRLNAGTFAGLTFRNIGPALTSGRISDIAVHPQDQSTWYVAVGSGGVWKTVNAGTTWTPLFDSQSAYSIGCVTIDPHRPEVIWVGSGENVSGRHVGFGDGVYRSLNGGKTWENMGLKQSEHISKILIDPRDSSVVYAAAEGPLWSSGGQRGIYKSSNGGRNWELSLGIGPDTGVSDVALDPQDPDILYAAAYQRRRTVSSFLAGGPESGIYKSGDAGKSWRRLAVGLPGGHLGRIGLAVSPQKPNVIYATIEADKEERGFYRSSDRGESWEKRSSYISNGTGPHYYQEIFADPHRFDRVYQMDVYTHVSDDGGKSFRKLGQQYKHSDNHALTFDPRDPDYLLAGTDGGLYETWDLGKTWKYAANLPVTQFYKMALDNSRPFYNVHGGSQDNGSQMGPSRTLNVNGIMNRDWFFTSGADGYACVIDPVDPNIIYASWQVGHLVRYDKRSGENVSIQPQPGAGDEPCRWNWDSPLIISPHSRTRLYYGSQRLYRSDDRGDTWRVVSPDLSRALFRLQREIMDKKWSIDALWDHDAMSYFGNLTAIAESPRQEGLIYAGTDDGLIQVSEDGGGNWRRVEKLPGVPSFFFVNDIQASLHDADTVYAAVDNHKTGDLKPYLLKSRDRGRSWQSMAGDLPPRHIVWAIAQDHVKPGLLFIGTEFGIFFTADEGEHWLKLNGGVPTISFRDIEIQRREDDLVGASFGRGFFILDDYSPLRQVDEQVLEQAAVLFPVKKALLFIPRKPFDLKEKAFSGHAFFTAPNPPFGAVFTYYLKDSLQTRKELRQEREKGLENRGQPVAFPGWETLRREDREEAPAIILTVRDQEGRIVRQVTGPTSAGFHRVAWDLRYPPVKPTSLEPPKEIDPWDEPPRGPLLVPGTFSVDLQKRVDGVVTPLSSSRTFVVESLGLQSLPAPDRQEVLAFQERAGRLQRALMGTAAVIRDALLEIGYIKKALMDTPGAEPGLAAATRAIERRLRDFQIELHGDRTIKRRREPSPPSLIDRVSRQLSTTTALTTTDKRSCDMAASRFETMLPELRQLIEVDLKRLQEKMEAAGAPWTPGRGLPRWQREK